MTILDVCMFALPRSNLNWDVLNTLSCNLKKFKLFNIFLILLKS